MAPHALVQINNERKLSFGLGHLIPLFPFRIQKWLVPSLFEVAEEFRIVNAVDRTLKYRIDAVLLATDAYLVPQESHRLTCKLKVFLPKIWKIDPKNTRNETKQILFSRLKSTSCPLIRLNDLRT
jgi:hypothetical protein